MCTMLVLLIDGAMLRANHHCSLSVSTSPPWKSLGPLTISRVTRVPWYFRSMSLLDRTVLF